MAVRINYCSWKFKFLIFNHCSLPCILGDDFCHPQVLSPSRVLETCGVWYVHYFTMSGNLETMKTLHQICKGSIGQAWLSRITFNLLKHRLLHSRKHFPGLNASVFINQLIHSPSFSTNSAVWGRHDFGMSSSPLTCLNHRITVLTLTVMTSTETIFSAFRNSITHRYLIRTSKSFSFSWTTTAQPPGGQCWNFNDIGANV
jgi:hypothetical protein